MKEDHLSVLCFDAWAVGDELEGAGRYGSRA
jgi:hypothetical protein